MVVEGDLSFFLCFRLTCGIMKHCIWFLIVMSHCIKSYPEKIDAVIYLMSYLYVSVKEVEHIQMDLICKNGLDVWSYKKKNVMRTTELDKNCFYTKYNI